MPDIAKASAMERLADYDFAFLQEPVSDRAYVPSDFAAAEAELRRFFGMILLQDEPLAVTNPDVDELWHGFMLRTRRYRSFCQDVFGEFIDHQPHTQADPVPASAVANTMKCYQRFYGDVPESWTMDPNLAGIDLKTDVLPDPLAHRWSGWPGRDRD